jgi:hypothetical protein
VTLEADTKFVPPPPSVRNWPALGWLAAASLAIAIVALWGRRTMARARQWTADAWGAALERLPGPFHSPLVLHDLVTHLPRADVEEAATLLGRSFAPDRVGQTLDVIQSLRQTVRSGMQPHLVFRPRRVQQPILVLQDVSQSMAPYEKRVTSLCRDLRRQGVALEMWCFDGDVGAASVRPFGPPSPLEQILAARHDHPVLILSAGFGVPATLSTDARWLAALRVRSRRAWVNPVVDPDLWPASLHRLPLLVAPMTRAGLLQAARELSADDSGRGGVSIHTTTVAPHVTPAHIHRLRQLASLVPHPMPEVLELLRQRFAPEIPESAVIYTVGARTAASDVPFQMTDEEIRMLLREVRAELPALEAQVRAYLLKVLGDSEPTPGSAAHVRWETSKLIHQVELADLQKTDGAAAISRLRELYHGPLWEEVRRVVAQQPSSGPAVERVKAAVDTRRGQLDPPSFAAAADDPAPPKPPRWRLPQWRDLTAAVLTAILVTFTGSLTGAFSSQTEHLRNAYELAYLPGAYANDPGRLQITMRPTEVPLPRNVQLFRDAEATGPPTTLSENTPSFVRIDSDMTLSVLQVRGVLPNGALALSNALSAPSNAPGAPDPTYDQSIPVETRRAIEAAVTRADRTEVDALRTLNPAPLYAVYAGAALTEALKTVETLRTTGVYVESTLHKWTFESVRLTGGGQRAEVNMITRNSANFLNIQTRMCIAHIHENDLSTTVSLQNTGRDWMIYETVRHSPEPTVTKCH